MERELEADSETIAIVHERPIRILSLVIRPENACSTHVNHEALYHSKDGGCTLLTGSIWLLQREDIPPPPNDAE